MKKIKKTLFAVCAAGAAACAALAAEKPVVVPAPVKMTVTGGECSANAEPKFVTVASIPPEGYELSVKKDGVTVRSSGAAGAFWIGKLPFGTYYMEETTSPGGYAKPTKYFQFKVDENGVSEMVKTAWTLTNTLTANGPDVPTP